MHHDESQEQFVLLGSLLSQWCSWEALTYILCCRSHGLVWTLLLFTAATSSSNCESSGSKACFVTACWWWGESVSKHTRTYWQPSASTSGEYLTLGNLSESTVATVHFSRGFFCLSLWSLNKIRIYGFSYFFKYYHFVFRVTWKEETLEYIGDDWKELISVFTLFFFSTFSE